MLRQKSIMTPGRKSVMNVTETKSQLIIIDCHVDKDCVICRYGLSVGANAHSRGGSMRIGAILVLGQGDI